MEKRDQIVEQFARATTEEVCDLIDNETFRTMDKASIPEAARIFGPRFVDIIKNANENAG